MRLVAALLAALLLAGCSAGPMERLAPAEGPREPHYEEHQGLVAPRHDQAYPFEVGADATLVNATLRLVPRSSGIVPPAPGVPDAATTAAPAQLTVALLDASGVVVASAAVDPAAPFATLLVEELSAPGAWTVRVSGTGASGSVDRQEYGASYILSIEVLYG